MSASKGRYLAWYLGPSLVGVSEHNPGAATLVFWAGTHRLARQMAMLRGLEATSREGPLCCQHTLWQLIVAQVGAAALDVFCPVSFPVLSFRVMPSVCGGQRCIRAKHQTVRVPPNSRPMG